MYPNKYISKLIEELINIAMYNSEFYKQLAANTLNHDDKNMIMQIDFDEEKHSKMLYDLYLKLNGDYPETSEPSVNLSQNLLDNISNALMTELDNIETYRTLLFALEDQDLKNMINEIIFDKQNHSAKLNYLYSKNKEG